MKKVKIMALHLGYGGIERAICILANNLSKKYDVEIISTYKLFDKPKHELNSDIKITYLMNDKPNKNEFITALKKFKIITSIKEGVKSFNILRKRKSLMKNYIKNSDADVIISTRDFHNKILGKFAKSNILKIGWEHNNFDVNNGYFKRVCNSVKNLDYFVLVSNDLYTKYNNALSNEKVNCIYIPNMIEDKKYITSKINNHNLINISRLSDEKGLFDLIDVIKLIKYEISDIKLDIIGDGLLYDELKRYIKANDLNKNITLLGFKESDEIHKIISQASLYVMTSFRESFGIVLLESYVHGVPAIAFDTAQGARELIKDNKYLINNRNKNIMATTIINYLNDSDLRKRLSKEAIDISKDYLDTKVVDKWFKIIK